jgi:predicted permease
MAGAGAAIKAFLALTHTPLGFDPDHVFTLNIALPKGTNTGWQARLNTNETIRKTIEEVPGVTSASVSPTWTPPFGGFNAKIEIQSKPTLTGVQGVLALVSPNEFATLRIPILAGRVFDDAELNRAAHLALVNEAFVKQFLPEGNPIGQNVRSPMLRVEMPDLLLAQAPDDWLEIIGVVGDARDDGIDRPIKPAVFLPYSFLLPPDVALLVRAKGNPQAAIQSVKRRLRELNPEFVVNFDHTLAFWLEAREWGQGRFIAKLFSLFAILALALAATGLYSVVSFAVTQRTQEVGIRMALGAPRVNILRLVITSTATMLGAGIAVGLVLSLALDHIVRAWAGGSPRDPLTLLWAASILILVAAIACIVPAWRAATLDPAVALRYE